MGARLDPKEAEEVMVKAAINPAKSVKAELKITQRVCRICSKTFLGRGRKCDKCSRKPSNCEICRKETKSRTAKVCHDCRPKKCKICGKDLDTSKSNWSKYCSGFCKEKNRKALDCIICGCKTETRNQKMCSKCRTKKCVSCNNTFIPKSATINHCSSRCREEKLSKSRTQKSMRNITIDNLHMRWCEGHTQYHSVDDFPKDKFYCKEWRSIVSIKKYEEDKKSEIFMQKRRDRRLFIRHGLTPNDVFQILENQDFSCLVCGSNESGNRPWCIDHDHSCCPDGRSCTKCRRGILCFRCNTGLGCLQDSVELLTTARSYIVNFRMSVFPGRKEVDRNRKRHLLINKTNFMSSYNIKHLYSIDLIDLIELIGEPVVCSICRSESPGDMSWNVDHDHECCPGRKSCGKCVRGVLCHLCNKGIGLLGDDPLLIHSAIDYLNAFANGLGLKK